MKIGILTYHRAHNYGATLQAYALLQYLRSEGFEVEIIDYWPPYRKGGYDLFSFANIGGKYRLLKIIKRFIKLTVVYIPKYCRYRKFKRFHEQKYPIIYGRQILRGKDITDTYDVYIFGSDQIWRYNTFVGHKRYDEVYWGAFPKKSENTHLKKITYAASMGKLDQIDGAFLSTHLENFDTLSVREDALRSLLQTYTKKTIAHVLDPIFLLSIDQWRVLLSKNPMEGKRYVLLYNLNRSHEAEAIAKRLAERYGMHIIQLYGAVWPPTLKTSVKYSAGPREFINYFMHADFVISTSFHGVVFAIHFRKQFVSLGMKQNSQRVQDILKRYGLESRYLSDISDIESLPPIDYSEIDAKLTRDVELSKDYLLRAIKG